MYFIVVVILLTQQYVNSHEQIEQGYHFVITRLEVNGSGSLKIFNGNRSEIQFWGHRISSNSNVEVGDSLVKEAKSDMLPIYKKGPDGKYRLFLTDRNNTLISPLLKAQQGNDAAP